MANPLDPPGRRVSCGPSADAPVPVEGSPFAHPLLSDLDRHHLEQALESWRSQVYDYADESGAEDETGEGRADQAGRVSRLLALLGVPQR